MASATPRRAGPKIISNSAWLPGIIGPDTAPCSTRKASSEGRLQDRPHSSEAIVKGQYREHEGAHHAEALHQPAGERHRHAVRDRERCDDPGALIGADAQIAGDGWNRDVGDAGVEHLHEGAERQRQRRDADDTARQRCRRCGRGRCRGRCRTHGRHCCGCAGATRRWHIRPCRCVPRWAIAPWRRCTHSAATVPAPEFSAMMRAICASTAGSSPALA